MSVVWKEVKVLWIRMEASGEAEEKGVERNRKQAVKERVVKYVGGK